MTELNSFDQIAGQIAGLVTTVKALPRSEKDCWAYVTKRLLKLPVDEDVNAVYFYILGKVMDAQMNDGDITKLNKYVLAAENALHTVTTTRRKLGIGTFRGAFANWEKEVASTFATTPSDKLGNMLMYHVANVYEPSNQ